MATKIAVMDGGVIQQFGTPDEIYGQPHNLVVAGFIVRLGGEVAAPIANAVLRTLLLGGGGNGGGADQEQGD